MLRLELCDVRDWRVRGMKDTEPKVLLSERLVEEPLTEEDLQQALVLGTGDLLRTSKNVFTSHVSAALDHLTITDEGEALLNQLIDKPNNGFASHESIKRTLLSTLAQDIMYIIWRESEFVTDRALSEAGLGRQFHDPCKHLTRNSLKNAVCDDLIHLTASGGDALKRSIDRICDALEVYGLINRITIRENLKPVCGTRRLHTLMSSANMAVSHVFAQQLQAEEGAHNG